MLRMRLHFRHRLDRGRPGADDGHAVVLPLLFLVVFVPYRGVEDFAFEFVFETGDVWPLDGGRELDSGSRCLSVM